MNLSNITKLVEFFLAYEPETRDDDDLLWIRVLETTTKIRDIPDFTTSMSFRDCLFEIKRRGFPHFKSVSRARRKLQRKYPELRGSEETQEARAELEVAYREFASGQL